MADLNITVDSKQVTSAKKDLLDLSNSFNSAQKSASVFEQAFMRAAAQMSRDMAVFNNVVRANQEIINKNLGVSKAYKSAEESARSFAIVLKNQEEQAKKTAVAINQIAGVSGKSAMSSGAGFSAIEKEIETLSLKYNDVYRASKLYETSLAELTRAEQLGAISTAKLNTEVDKLNAEFQQFQAGTNNLNNRFVQFDAGMQASGKASKRMQLAIQQAGYQVGDFFVQVASGTNPLIAFTQQFTQLVSFLGPYGPAIGAVASIVGAVAVAFWKGSEAAKTFKDSIGDLKTSVSELQAVTENYTQSGVENLISKYGELNSEILNHIQLLKEVAVRNAADATRDTLQGLQNDLDGFLTTTTMSLQNMFKVNVGAANELASSLEKAKTAASFDQQVVYLTQLRDQILNATGGISNMTREQFDFYKKVQDSLDAMMQLAESEPKASWLSSAITSAIDLANNLWSAVTAKAKLAEEAAKPGMTTGTPLYEQGMYGSSLGLDLSGPGILGGKYPKTTGGGGRGKSEDTIENKLKQLYEYMGQVEAYQIEAENIAYQQREDTLKAALDKKLITLQEYNDVEKSLTEKHQAELAQIQAAGHLQQLSDAGTFFGALASVAQAGGGKMVKVAAVFSAGQALINSWVAYTEMLKDPSFIGRPWARFAAAASVLAAGLNAVMAIKSVGSGGGSSASASSKTSSVTSSAATQAPQTVYVSGLDPNALFTGEMVQNLFESFYDENNTRGQVFVVAR